MAEYVSRILLEVDGQAIEDFKEVTEEAFEKYKKVELMNRTGHAEKTSRYGIKVTYVIPKDSTEFDWISLKNGRLTIDRQNGKRITFLNVHFIGKGEIRYSPDNEATYEVTLSAEERKEE